MTKEQKELIPTAIKAITAADDYAECLFWAGVFAPLLYTRFSKDERATIEDTLTRASDVLIEALKELEELEAVAKPDELKPRYAATYRKANAELTFAVSVCRHRLALLNEQRDKARDEAANRG
jgi:hypothetical protein